jgi:hypothetical protein
VFALSRYTSARINNCETLPTLPSHELSTVFGAGRTPLEQEVRMTREMLSQIEEEENLALMFRITNGALDNQDLEDLDYLTWLEEQ